MARPASTSQRARPATIRFIAAVLIALVIVIATIVIIWAVLQPKKMLLSVDQAAVSGFNFTNGRGLNGTFDLTLRANNRNKHAAVYYDNFEVAVWFSDQYVAGADVPGFYQPQRNETRIDVAAQVIPAALPQDVLRGIKEHRSAGNLPVEVRVRAKVRFGIGVAKTRHHNLRASCPWAVVDFASPTKFHRVYCHVKI